jgi:hypothetical protein
MTGALNWPGNGALLVHRHLGQKSAERGLDVHVHDSGVKALGARNIVKPVQQVPLVFPDTETERVEVLRTAACRWDSNHRHLTRRNPRPANITHLSAAWSKPHIRHPFMRQTTIQESAPDNRANNVWVHMRSLSVELEFWSVG